MRLWTLHPRYLDRPGLLAVWREALLAQRVLEGRTAGYRSHPQLTRFRESGDPLGAIAGYLRGVRDEGLRRGYRFDGEKIGTAAFSGRLECTRGQLLYEWRHLEEKLALRDPQRLPALATAETPEAHPLFRIVEGDVEAWEKVSSRQSG